MITPQQQQQQQFLRVRRRRGAVAVPSLRVGLDTATTTTTRQNPVAPSSRGDVVTEFSRVGLAEPPQPALPQHQQVLFRRIADPGLGVITNDGGGGWLGSRKRRVIDAVILEDDENDGEEEMETTTDVRRHSSNTTQQPWRKRRKLQLLLPCSPHDTDTATTTTKPVVVEYPILTPTQCLVDESLKAVFAGTQSLAQHLQDLPPDDAHGDYSNNNYAWNNRGGLGNWLHAAALWNELDVVRGEFVASSSSLPSSSSSVEMLRKMLTTRDAEGRTPAHLATLAGHDELAQWLEAQQAEWGDNPTIVVDENTNQHQGDEYEYDYYCWQPTVDLRQQQQQQQDYKDGDDDDDEEEIWDCELHDRCTGYFDANGELVLDPTGMAAYAAGGNDGGDDDDDDEEDRDSNHEDWEGNDYPDEDDGSSSSSTTAGSDFRQRRVSSYETTGIRYRSEDHDDDTGAGGVDPYNDEYDAAYGGIYGQDDNEEYDEEC